MQPRPGVDTVLIQLGGVSPVTPGACAPSWTVLRRGRVRTGHHATRVAVRLDVSPAQHPSLCLSPGGYQAGSGTGVRREATAHPRPSREPLCLQHPSFDQRGAEEERGPGCLLRTIQLGPNARHPNHNLALRSGRFGSVGYKNGEEEMKCLPGRGEKR